MIEPAYPNRCPSTVSWHAAGTVPASSCSPCPDFVARISRIHRDGTQRLSARYMHHQAGSTAYCTYMYSNSIDPLARRQNRPACLAPHCTPLRTSTDNSAGPSRHREMTCTCRGTRSTHAGWSTPTFRVQMASEVPPRRAVLVPHQERHTRCAVVICHRPTDSFRHPPIYHPQSSSYNTTKCISSCSIISLHTPSPLHAIILPDTHLSPSPHVR
jgi:hypothetical protein